MASPKLLIVKFKRGTRTSRRLNALLLNWHSSSTTYVGVPSHKPAPSYARAQMSILVEQQDETIDVIEETATHVEKDTEAGLGHTMKAVESARSARKKRWICFGLFALLLVIVAIIIAVVVLNNRKSELSSIVTCVAGLLTGFCRIKSPGSNLTRDHAQYLPVHAPVQSLSTFSTTIADKPRLRSFPDVSRLVFSYSSVELGFVLYTSFCEFTPSHETPRRSDLHKRIHFREWRDRAVVFRSKCDP